MPTLVGEQAKRHGGVQWSTDEVETQLTCAFTGARIFRKALDLGLLPNATSATDAHGISNLNLAVGAHLSLTAYASNATQSGSVEALSNEATNPKLMIDATNITVDSGTTDLSAYHGLAYIEYTKST